ncbi:hypothetical protein ABIB25_001467 [Nakamurella sp. UYEF19]|uniref:hypothetical protein n=1 Tax=Nakamurella sp. UYEF19 TaxID=1756392 RepID=UPI0033994591
MGWVGAPPSSGTGPALPGSVSAFSTPSAGTGAGTAPVGFGAPAQGSTIRRYPAHPERWIEPSTTNLLRSPSVAPPRSAPRPPAPGAAAAAAVSSSELRRSTTAAVPAPPFAPGTQAGGPAVPQVAQRVSAEGANGQAGSTIRRSSLLDQAPASLFDRALAQIVGGANEGRSPATIRRGTVMGSSDIGMLGHQEESKPGSIAASLTPREWDQLVDIIVERLEDRVSDELARRGRRFTPGVM